MSVPQESQEKSTGDEEDDETGETSCTSGPGFRELGNKVGRGASNGEPAGALGFTVKKSLRDAGLLAAGPGFGTTETFDSAGLLP